MARPRRANDPLTAIPTTAISTEGVNGAKMRGFAV